MSSLPLLPLLLLEAAAAAASQGEEDEAEKESSWKGWRRLKPVTGELTGSFVSTAASLPPEAVAVLLRLTEKKKEKT